MIVLPILYLPHCTTTNCDTRIPSRTFSWLFQTFLAFLLLLFCESTDVTLDLELYFAWVLKGDVEKVDRFV